MTINFNNSPNSYLTDRYNFIRWMEEVGGIPSLTPYVDSKGWITIGVGFNLHDPDVCSQVLAGMGITDAIKGARFELFSNIGQS
jgi:GH24 family phage-related lysozyme (muramidase)